SWMQPRKHEDTKKKIDFFVFSRLRGCIASGGRRRSTAAGVGTKHDHHEGDSCGRPSEKRRRTARCDTSQIEGEENEQCEREHARDEARGARPPGRSRRRLELRLGRRRSAPVADERLVGDLGSALAAEHYLLCGGAPPPLALTRAFALARAAGARRSALRRST